MLKRSITGAVVILVLSCCVGAGDIKIHGWSTPLSEAESHRLDVVIDIGYFIHIVDQKPIQVIQDTSTDDPYHNYIGCKNTDVISNFNAVLMAESHAVGIAGGTWSANINPSIISSGTTSVTICVKGNNVIIENLNGSEKGAKVAEVVVMVLPQ